MPVRKFLSVAVCAVPMLYASADNVDFVTSLQVGEKMTLAVGGEATATIRWADGTTNKLDAAGKPLEVELKSQSFSVESNGAIRYIYAPGAGLTSISFSGAPSIEALYLQNNKLSSINFDKLPNLRSLDVQGNAFTSLNVGGKCKYLEYLNCSYNSITSLFTGRLEQLRTLICAGNKVSSISVDNLPNLQQLWCQDNNVKIMSLAKATSLSSLYAYNNSIVRFSGIGENMKRLWLDYNQLESMDLSQAKDAEEVSLDHNKLHEVEMSVLGRTRLKYFYANDNALGFNSFPTLKRLEAYNVSPQADYVFDSSPKVGERFSIDSPFGRDAWKSDVKSVVTWYDKTSGKALTEGTDYSASGNYITFLKAYPEVYAKATSEFFPGLTIQTAPFAIGGTTSVETATAARTIEAEQGQLVVNTDKAFRLRVFSTDGKLVVDTEARPGRSTYSMEKGLYVVDGAKVLVP